MSNFCKGWYFKTVLDWIHELRISLDASFILDFGSTGLCFFIILFSFYDCGVSAKGGSLGSDHVPIISTSRKHAGNIFMFALSLWWHCTAPSERQHTEKKKKKKRKEKNTNNNKNIDAIQVRKNGNLIGIVYSKLLVRLCGLVNS